MLMRINRHPAYRRGLKRAPAGVKAWAATVERAATDPNATPESVMAGAEALRGNLRGWFVRKYRDRSQGEWRLLFQVRGGDEVFFLWLGTREDDYKSAGRLVRGM